MRLSKVASAILTDCSRTISTEARCMQVDHRSVRSSSSSFSRVVQGTAGFLASLDFPLTGGRSHPLRSMSASMASPASSDLQGAGGVISATTMSLSMTRIVSPDAARFTYSLSLFLRVFKPTARIMTMVAPVSYSHNAVRFEISPYLLHSLDCGFHNRMRCRF
jgi:hypothetical protein